MSATKIEWCDHTINPTVGCMKCGPGCANCYAEKIAAIRVKHPNPKISGKYAGTVDEAGKWTGHIGEADYSVFERLPKTPKRIFIGSMTDLFLRGVNDAGHKAAKSLDGSLSAFTPDTMHTRIARILVQVGRYPQHTFMVLTKRPEAMKEALDALLPRPLLNLWVGVTVCNQQEADEKIPKLLNIPAALRFISFEPLLEVISLWKWFPEGACEKPAHYGAERFTKNLAYENGIHWVICGGETGPDARPVHPDWVRGLRDQCVSADVPFFFKGWGEFVFDSPWHSEKIVRVGKKHAGRLLDGREWNEVPV